VSERYVIHTDAPIAGSTQHTAAFGHPDCFYGWGEPAEPVRGCKPHWLAVRREWAEAYNLAARIRDLTTAQVVVTDYDDWSVVIEDMPFDYDHDHAH
jgi:hypothetical protein